MGCGSHTQPTFLLQFHPSRRTQTLKAFASLLIRFLQSFLKARVGIPLP